MSNALIFLLICSLKNRLVARLKRLRRPKYAISVTAGLVYIGFFIWHQANINRTRAALGPELPMGELSAVAEVGFAVILLAAAIIPWFYQNSRTVLFNEAEILFLYQAPIRRSTLFNYRIAGAQLGILFAALISAAIFGRGGFFPHTGYLFVTAWSVYFFLFLYRIAVLLARKKLEEHGIAGKTYRLWVLGPASAFIILVAVWIGSMIPTPPAANGLNLVDLASWLTGIAESGPALYVLFPFRLMVRPALSPDFSHFMPGLVPLIVLLALLYASIQRGNSHLNEEQHKSPRLPDRTPRKPIFRLSPDGNAYIAIYWKNLASSGLGYTQRIVPILAGIAILSILVILLCGENVASFIGATATAFALFFAVFGPVLFRDDLRIDLEHIDMLKTYPIRGWRIVLGEVLGPATLLTMLEWVCVVLATTAMPRFMEFPVKIFDQISIGFAALILLPCLSFMGVLIQNAAVLILPGWVQIGRKQPQGIEAMGQRLLSTAATMLFLLVGALPAALLFFAVIFAGYQILGTAMIPLASLMAAFVLLLEAGLGLFWLGGRFERLDASKEMHAVLP